MAQPKIISPRSSAVKRPSQRQTSSEIDPKSPGAESNPKRYNSKRTTAPKSPNSCPVLPVPLLKKPPTLQELQAQRKSKISHYGRRHGSAKAVPVPVDLQLDSAKIKRCGWITSQSDDLHIAYHDQEWGVPVYDDKMLFELLTLAGAQSELSWSAILERRDSLRAAFCDFDPAILASYDASKVTEIRFRMIDVLQQDGKVQSVVDNAKNVLRIAEAFGSFHKYIWGFFNHRPLVTSFKLSSQVPIKSSRSEVISKDLIARGFRNVAPAVVYSFMQSAGMTNDHSVHCFRHKECTDLYHVPL